MYKTNTGKLHKPARRQTSQGPQDPRNSILLSSLSFFSASYTTNLELKKPAAQKCQWTQGKEPPAPTYFRWKKRREKENGWASKTEKF